MSYQIIDNQPALLELAAKLEQAQALAIDTEFMRQRTYFPQLALIQIYDGSQIYLIDPLPITDWQPLKQILASDQIVKVFHSCSEDCEVFKTALGVRLTRVFDTQIAEAFIAGDTALGLLGLVDRYKGLTLDKGHSRTDWLQRPLSPEQLHYAANDVRWLLDVYHTQKQQLGEWHDAVFEDVDEVVNKKFNTVKPESAWREVKCAWQLKPKALAILRELIDWRLRLAIERDLAVNFVVKEKSLTLLAQRAPSTIDSMRNVPGIHPMEVRKHGKVMLELINKGKALPPEHWPVKVARLSDFPAYKDSYAELKEKIGECAKQLGINVELLASKKQINQYLAYKWQVLPWSREVQPALFRGWRYQQLKSLLDLDD